MFEYLCSEVNEVNVLVLNDLYHHINGELEGREIAPGHFKEVMQFLLEVDAFQNYQCKHDRDSWPSENDIYMFDVVRLRKDLGIELWDHTAWKASRSHAERMLSLMHHANSVKFLAFSKNSSLRALTCLLSVYMRDVSTLLQALSLSLCLTLHFHIKMCASDALPHALFSPICR